jgi:hypothetical protein
MAWRLRAILTQRMATERDAIACKLPDGLNFTRVMTH